MQNHEPGASVSTEFVLTNVEAVLAGTLALMTAMVQGCCEEHRRAIRRKVIANLAELERHEHLSDQFPPGRLPPAAALEPAGQWAFWRPGCRCAPLACVARGGAVSARAMDSRSCLPVVHSRNLAGLLAHYRATLGFELLQEISGVVAVLRKGSLRLQLWQSGDTSPRACSIPLERRTSVFQLYADLAKVARSAMVDDCPRLRPWGTWEFTMCDPEGNRLTFRQMAVGAHPS